MTFRLEWQLILVIDVLSCTNPHHSILCFWTHFGHTPRLEGPEDKSMARIARSQNGARPKRSAMPAGHFNW